MDGWIIWTIMMAVLITVEVFTLWVWTFSMAVGCLCAIAASLAGISLPVQIGIMAGVSVVAYFICVPFARRWYARLWNKHGHSYRTGMDALLGRHAVVVDEIKPGALGRVRIDGDCWQAKAPGVDHTIPHGAHISVTAYDSIILTVEPVK